MFVQVGGGHGCGLRGQATSITQRRPPARIITLGEWLTRRGAAIAIEMSAWQKGEDAHWMSEEPGGPTFHEGKPSRQCRYCYPPEAEPRPVVEAQGGLFA